MFELELIFELDRNDRDRFKTWSNSKTMGAHHHIFILILNRYPAGAGDIIKYYIGARGLSEQGGSSAMYLSPDA